MLFELPMVNGNESVQELTEHVAKLQKMVMFMMNGKLSGDNIRANSITAEEIAAQTITANEIAADTITADKMDVNQLSAISADLGSITAGTVTGATLQTAASGARVVIVGNKTTVYDSSGIVSIVIDATTIPPKINFYDAGVLKTSMYYFGGSFVLAGNGGTSISDLVSLVISNPNLTGTPKVNGTNIDNKYGASLSYNSGTKTLSLLSASGTTLSTVSLV